MLAESEGSAECWLCPKVWVGADDAKGQGGPWLWGLCPGSHGHPHLWIGKVGCLPMDTPSHGSVSDSLHTCPVLVGVAVALRLREQLPR